MTDRPILFSGTMIRALLEGRKTQTRRILKPQPPADMGLVGVYAPALTAVFGYVTPDADFKVPLRYMPGDRLWVRESLADTGNGVGYVADGTVDPSAVWAWKRGYLPSIHMPRGLSRLTLTVTDVRVERLQEITNEDCIAEGIPVHPNENAPRAGLVQDDFARRHGLISHYGAEYRRLWDSLNASRGFGWEVNPWVAALTFEVIRQNIDAIERAAA